MHTYLYFLKCFLCPSEDDQSTIDRRDSFKISNNANNKQSLVKTGNVPNYSSVRLVHSYTKQPLTSVNPQLSNQQETKPLNTEQFPTKEVQNLYPVIKETKQQLPSSIVGIDYGSFGSTVCCWIAERSEADKIIKVLPSKVLSIYYEIPNVQTYFGEETLSSIQGSSSKEIVVLDKASSLKNFPKFREHLLNQCKEVSKKNFDKAGVNFDESLKVVSIPLFLQHRFTTDAFNIIVSDNVSIMCYYLLYNFPDIVFKSKQEIPAVRSKILNFLEKQEILLVNIGGAFSSVCTVSKGDKDRINFVSREWRFGAVDMLQTFINKIFQKMGEEWAFTCEGSGNLMLMKDGKPYRKGTSHLIYKMNKEMMNLSGFDDPTYCYNVSSGLECIYEFSDYKEEYGSNHISISQKELGLEFQKMSTVREIISEVKESIGKVSKVIVFGGATHSFYFKNIFNQLSKHKEFHSFNNEEMIVANGAVVSSILNNYFGVNFEEKSK